MSGVRHSLAPRRCHSGLLHSPSNSATPAARKPDPLEWDPFQNAFLPKADPKAEHALLSTIRITEGLVREVKRENEAVTYRIVNPHELMIETDSVVPCSEVQRG